MNRSKRIACVVAAAGLVTGVTGTAGAQTVYEWTGLGDGQSFGSVLNWTPQGVPGALDAAEFDTVGPASVVLGQARTVDILSIENHSVVLSGGAFGLTASELIVGERSGDFGSLEVVSGGVTSGAGLGIIGKFAGATGVVTLRSGSTLATTADLIVGDEGTGTLVVDAGATVTTPLLFVADEPGSMGDAMIEGNLTVTGSSLLGNGGTGVVDIFAGAQVSCNGGFKIGDNPGGSGTVTVRGAATRMTSSMPSAIGNLSFGQMTVRGSARLETTGLTVGDEAAGELIVRGDASVVDSVQVRVSNADTSTGLLRLANGGLVDAPTIAINDWGTAEGEGTLRGSVVNDGSVAPGLSLGRLIVDGAYHQMGGDLIIELGGADAGTNYDQLVVTGTATLGGALRVSLVNGFNPANGEFVIVDAGLVSGTFNIEDVPAGFTVRYESGRVVLSVGSSCIADFNGDGSVDTRDVLAFLNAWSAGDSSADVNGDGLVDTRDVLAYLNLWNAGC